MTHGFERTLPWAVAALAIVVWLVPLQLGVWGNHVITDIPVYQEAWRHMADGQVPYRDFALEYPPFAAGLFWLAGTIPGIYAAVFSGLMLACLIATAVAAVAIARVLGMPPLGQAAAGVAVALGPLVLGALVQTRYDLALAAAMAWMLWAAVTRRFTLMWTLLAVAVLVKLVPLALIPVLIIWQRHNAGMRSAVTGCAGALAGIALVVLPFALMSPSGIWNMVGYHLDRPLQIEASGAAYMLGLHALADIPLTVENSFGSQGLSGRGPAVIAGLLTAVGIALLVAIAWSLWVGLRRARPPGDGRLFVAAVCATIATLLVSGKVLSPQFLIWLMPAVFLVAGRYGRATFALGIAAMVLTFAYFPHRYWDLVALDTWPIALLVLRDLALVALLAACWPRPSIAGRPRGWVLGAGEPNRSERAISARYLAD